MGTAARLILLGCAHHVTQPGNHQQRVFFCDTGERWTDVDASQCVARKQMQHRALRRNAPVVVKGEFNLAFDQYGWSELQQCIRIRSQSLFLFPALLLTGMGVVVNVTLSVAILPLLKI